MTLALLPFLILGDDVAGLLLSFTSLDTLTLFFTLLSSEVPAEAGLARLQISFQMTKETEMRKLMMMNNVRLR